MPPARRFPMKHWTAAQRRRCICGRRAEWMLSRGAQRGRRCEARSTSRSVPGSSDRSQKYRRRLWRQPFQCFIGKRRAGGIDGRPPIGNSSKLNCDKFCADSRRMAAAACDFRTDYRLLVTGHGFLPWYPRHKRNLWHATRPAGRCKWRVPGVAISLAAAPVRPPATIPRPSSRNAVE